MSSDSQQHYKVISPWGGMELGCHWDTLGKDGKSVLDERDVILKACPPESCPWCDGQKKEQ